MPQRRPPVSSASLFDDTDFVEANAPLATRMRPRTLDEFVGQEHLVGEGRPLRRAIDADITPSCVLWGPPGSGKTTLARIIARQTQARFATVSAVAGGVADVRKVIAEAEALSKANGARTILFIDEIHRFNKAQQDTVLHAVEDGTVTLIGATTENPSFEVISPLLSRCRVFTLKPLEPDDIRALLERALRDPERGLGKIGVGADDDAFNALVAVSGGDARVALNALELAVRDAEAAGAAAIDRARVEAVAQRRLRYDKAGDAHYDTISAFIKSIRGSDPDAAVYWLGRMLEAGEDPLFVARRLVIAAAEDIGLADPRALSVAVAAQQAVHFIGMPEGFLPLSEATLYLALAPKSNSALTAYTRALTDIREQGDLPVPLHLRNAVTGLMRSQGYGVGYQYAHDYDGGVPPDQAHRPHELEGHAYYTPGDQGEEPDLERNRRERG